MWNPKEILKSQGHLDFSSSGQGIVEAYQIYFDDMLMCNGVEFLEIDDSTIQFIVCSSCGYARCEPGNFLTLRRLGKFVLLIPSFDEMEEDDFEMHEFGAPSEVNKRGAIYLTEFQYQQFYSFIPKLRQLDLKQLTKKEAALLIQWEAPNGVLGSFPGEIKFNKELYLATTSDEEEGIIGILDNLLADFYYSKEQAVVQEAPHAEVSIFLDTFEFVEWKPICEINKELHLKLLPNFVLNA